MSGGAGFAALLSCVAHGDAVPHGAGLFLGFGFGFRDAAAVATAAIVRPHAALVVAPTLHVPAPAIIHSLTAPRVVLAKAPHDLFYQPHTLLLFFGAPARLPEPHAAAASRTTTVSPARIRPCAAFAPSAHDALPRSR